MHGRSPFDDMPEIDVPSARILCWLALAVVLCVALLVALPTAQAQPASEAEIRAECAHGCVVMSAARWREIERRLVGCVRL